MPTGCILFEESLLPVQKMQEMPEKRIKSEYTLGIASGRMYQEAVPPLEKYGLLRYFHEKHLGTYDLVRRGEKALQARGYPGMLGKPHPFHFQAAVDWQQALRYLSDSTAPAPDTPFIMVGDSTSDILGGQGARALTVAVLTGACSPEARALLLDSGPDFVIEDMSGLPVLLSQLDSLNLIEQLQFTRREAAEWFLRHMDLPTQSIHLTSRAVSLNSLNGFYQRNKQDFFFKTHVAAHDILNDYDHAQLLETAGYNVVRPLRSVCEQGHQMVIYPAVIWPVLCNLLHALETAQQVPAGITERMQLEVEQRECARKLEIYRKTFQARAVQLPQSPPLRQLFWHRLNGERFQALYTANIRSLPAGSQPCGLPFAALQNYYWITNVLRQPHSLGELIQQARETLHPARAMATVVGHSNSHAGNVCAEQESLDRPSRPASAVYRYRYFGPALAGRHSPLLDIVKPLYHDVFATWMYFPDEVAQGLHLAVQVDSKSIRVEHTYHLTPMRQALLRTRYEQLLVPLTAWLEEQDALPQRWQEFPNLALMCCPLLTMNLLAAGNRLAEADAGGPTGQCGACALEGYAMICIVDYGWRGQDARCSCARTVCGRGAARCASDTRGLDEAIRQASGRNKTWPGTRRRRGGRVETRLYAPVSRRAAGSDGGSRGNRGWLSLLLWDRERSRLGPGGTAVAAHSRQVGMSMLLVPAIDPPDRRCVRLYQGNSTRVTGHADDLLALAQRWLHDAFAAGAKSHGCRPVRWSACGALSTPLSRAMGPCKSLILRPCAFCELADLQQLTLHTGVLDPGEATASMERGGKAAPPSLPGCERRVRRISSGEPASSAQRKTVPDGVRTAHSAAGPHPGYCKHPAWARSR
jgi:phosphoglycolate phosphatase-like HAD superfamily hydrolase